MDKWLIEALHSSHQHAGFCCGQAPLDKFLHALVKQYDKRNLGRTFAAVHPGDKRVWGYYTLAAGAVPFQNLLSSIAKSLPRHPVPVILLARLAVTQEVQGQGLGKLLLIDALQRCLDLAEDLGIFAVEVDALYTQAKDFYLKFGFTSLLDNHLHLYLPLATIEAAFKKKAKS